MMHKGRIAKYILTAMIIMAVLLFGAGAVFSYADEAKGIADPISDLTKDARGSGYALSFEGMCADALEGYGQGHIAYICGLPAETEITEADLIRPAEEYFVISEIKEGDQVYKRIYGKSFTPNYNIGLSGLRYIRVLHYDFDGKIRTGEIIVNARIAADTCAVFKELYDQKYQIFSMKLIDDFWGSDAQDADYNAVESDNTSGFCYRTILGRSTLSNHALGYAIDINPRENPWATWQNGAWETIGHPNLREYANNRSADRPHMITREDAAYKAFTSHGFFWGGNWAQPDYQHFEKRA